MNITRFELGGVLLVEGEPVRDERGAFTRLLDRDELRVAGVAVDGDQHSLSQNTRAGTLRGMHWQADPHPEIKLVRCARGALYDVVLDMRDGPTRGRWVAVELRAGDGRTLQVPPGCAHGFQTLEDDTDVHYIITGRHAPDAARGVRFDDPRYAIRWPDPPSGGRIMSARDASWPLAAS